MVEFQFFEGCPNSEPSLRNLMELVDENVIPEQEINIVEIKSPEDADKFNFQGSPSILIDCIDIYTNDKPKGSKYSCRSYIFDGRRTGVISKEYIKLKYIESKNST